MVDLMNIFSDVTSVLYGLITLFSFYGFGLFLYWWLRTFYKASSMYLYIMLLFLGMGICYGTSLYVRALGTVDWGAKYIFVEHSLLWPGRLVIVTLIVICIVMHMTLRMIRGWIRKNGRKNSNRRR